MDRPIPRRGYRASSARQRFLCRGKKRHPFGLKKRRRWRGKNRPKVSSSKPLGGNIDPLSDQTACAHFNTASGGASDMYCTESKHPNLSSCRVCHFFPLHTPFLSSTSIGLGRADDLLQTRVYHRVQGNTVRRCPVNTSYPFYLEGNIKCTICYVLRM